MNKLDDILYDLQRYFVQDPDTGDFIEYDMNASLQLLEQAIIDLFLDLAESCYTKDGFGQTIIVPAELLIKTLALAGGEKDEA